MMSFRNALVLGTLVALGAYALAAREADTNPVRAGEEHWAERIQAVGGRAAYRELSDEIASRSSGEQHKEAHLFGAALFATEGISGISVCDARFAQGCMHEFMGRAIAEEGILVVERLNRACRDTFRERSFFCEHGIGHGVLGYFGYDEPSLAKALSVCERGESEDLLNGCYTGVFMEYYLRNVLSGGVDPRPLEGGDWYAPCPTLQGTSRWLCYYARGQWWNVLLKREGLAEPDILARMLALCDEAAGQDRMACLRGIGHIVPYMVEQDIPRVREMCDAFGPEPLRVLCLAEASNAILLERGSTVAEVLCKGLSGESRAYCDAYAHQPDQKNIRTPYPFAE